MQLTAAGEVFVHYLRGNQGEAERMKSHIEDLKGLRRGTVRIACSQALALDFLPRQIAAFRKKHPLVSFEVKVADHQWAMAALAAYEVDLVLVFRPPFLANFRPLMTLEQRIVALMAADHPLAKRPAIVVLNIVARDIDEMGVVHLHGAGRHARQAGQTAIEMMHRLGVRRPAFLEHGANEVDAAAR